MFECISKKLLFDICAFRMHISASCNTSVAFNTVTEEGTFNVVKLIVFTVFFF